LPASAAATISSVWKRAGAAITTASTSGSVHTCAASAYERSAPSMVASAAAAPGAGSATATRRVPGSRRLIVSPWKDPIRPDPISAVPSGFTVMTAPSWNVP
jgi:hypothetical protein